MIKELCIDCEKETRKIIDFIKKSNRYLKTRGCVIGLSGGVDSSLCAKLAIEALGKENVLGVIMPAKDSDPSDLIVAKRLAKSLGIEFEIKPITPLLELYKVYELAEKYDFDTEIKPAYVNRELFDRCITYPKEHLFMMKLRGRAYTLSDLAYRNSYFQCQTINRTEMNLTWYDVFGDMIGDVAFLDHLWKSQVYNMAKFFGLDSEILNRPSGSGNFPLSNLDELGGGMTWQEIDIILYYLEKGILNDGELQRMTSLDKKSINKIKIRFLQSKESLIRPLSLEFFETKKGRVMPNECQ